jgi:uncharacterized protein YhaN
VIFNSAYIEGFGIFNDFSLLPLQKGVNIIYGKNEVGKSTLLSFLRFTLFGYPRLKDLRMPPLNGGTHGGRIRAILSSGKEVTLERTGDDKIKLSYDNIETTNSSYWNQFLTNASGDLYNNIYAFSLNELIDLDTLSASGVEDKIFSIGLGLGHISIGEVEENMQNHIDLIYKPGGKGKDQIVPHILKEIENKKEKIKQIQESLSKYQSLSQEINEHEEETIRIEKDLEQMRLENIKLDNYLKSYESYISIKRVSERLQNLPQLFDYPEKGVEQIDLLERRKKELSDTLTELKLGNKEEKGINALKRDIDTILFNEELLEHENDVEYLRKELSRYIQVTTDKKGDESKILEYQNSINDGIKHINAAWTEQNITDFANSSVHEDILDNFKKKFEKINNDRRNLEAELKAEKGKETRFDFKKLISIIAAVFIIGSIPSFYYELYILGVAILMIAALLFFSKKLILKKDASIYTQQQLEGLKNNEKEITEEYQTYLVQTLNLSKSLSVDATSIILRKIEQLKSQINEQDKLKEKIEKERLPFIKEFELKVSFLIEPARLEIQLENLELMVNKIITEFSTSKSKSVQRDKLIEELNRKNKHLQITEHDIEQNQNEINKLLGLIQAFTEAEFRKKYQENNSVSDFIKEKEIATKTIEKIAGANKISEVIRYLEKNEKETIEYTIKKLARDIDSLSQLSREKNSELGGKRNEIKRIEGESELLELLNEVEAERQKLRDSYKEWMSYKVAQKILTEVKSKFEKEKQPDVIKRSSSYFKKITGEKYNRILASLEKKNITIYDSEEASKKIGQLSRGTKEQLLISLRLGFIEEYEKQAESLPIIVDEVLVNFDSYRAKQTAEILEEFGRERQILIFTCHSTTRDYFDKSKTNFIELTESK